MMKVDINFKKRSWEVKEVVNLFTFSYDNFDTVLKSVQMQTNAILSQLVQEESANGKEISVSESDCDEAEDEPKLKRKKIQNVLIK